VLDDLEARLPRWWDAATGQGSSPDTYDLSALGPVPDRLRTRAIAVLAGQREVEAAMAARLAVLGAAVHGAALRQAGSGDRRPVPVFVDRRA